MSMSFSVTPGSSAVTVIVPLSSAMSTRGARVPPMLRPNQSSKRESTCVLKLRKCSTSRLRSPHDGSQDLLDMGSSRGSRSQSRYHLARYHLVDMGRMPLALILRRWPHLAWGLARATSSLHTFPPHFPSTLSLHTFPPHFPSTLSLHPFPP